MRPACSLRPMLMIPIISMIALCGPVPANAEAPLAGRWHGAIEVPGTPLEVSVELIAGDAGWSGTIDIPVQGARALPLAGIEIVEASVRFRIAAIPGEPTFSGTLSDGTIAGDFTQGGQRFEFKLERAGAESNDSAPPPDDDEVGTELWLENERGRLHGTLTLPDGEAPFPVVLMIAGSGPTDRDGNNPLLPGRNNMLKLMALELSGRSIASLRFDKRGIGGSAAAGIAEIDLRFEDFVADALAWTRLLQADDRFSSVVVLGHSEGSLIGMLAALESKADGFVSIAGPGRPAYEVIEAQLKAQPEAIQAESRRVLTELRAGRTVADADPDLAALYRPSIQQYLISWFKYDPARVIAQLKMPALIVQGTTDIQVPVSEGELLRAAKPDASYVTIEGMNHVLKSAPADRAANIATYGDPTLPLADGVIESLTAFVGATAGSAPAD